MPKNATKLRISNRIADDGLIKGTESPEVYGVVDEIPRLANINDVNNIKKINFYTLVWMTLKMLYLI